MGHKPELWPVQCVWAEHLAHETLPQSFPLSQQRPVGASGDTEGAEPQTEGARVLGLTSGELPHWQDLRWCEQ